MKKTPIPVLIVTDQGDAKFSEAAIEMSRDVEFFQHVYDAIHSKVQETPELSENERVITLMLMINALNASVSADRQPLVTTAKAMWFSSFGLAVKDGRR